jgi:hypothetical protein
MSDLGGGNPSAKFLPLLGIFSNPSENNCPPRPKTIKKHCSCILEGCLTTNPILSALHLQGLKSIIYVHFHLVNKPLNGISFWKWNHQPRTLLTWKSKNYKILVNIEVIILPFEIVFVILKWHLNLVCWCGMYIL